MVFLILFFLSLAYTTFTMPPPPGLNLKPAKAIGEEEPKMQMILPPAEVSREPPNLRLRSRMMAALNAEESNKRDLIPVGSQPLILTKNRKYNKQPSRSFFGAVTEQPITSEPATRPPPKSGLSFQRSQVPSTANYGVNPVLQTNFVDAHGRVLKNVVSIPIRVGDAKIKQISSSSASAALVEGEAEKGVQVKFGQAPI